MCEYCPYNAKLLSVRSKGLCYSLLLIIFFVWRFKGVSLFIFRKLSEICWRHTIAYLKQAIEYRAGSESRVVADLLDREPGRLDEQRGGMLQAEVVEELPYGFVSAAGTDRID